MSDPFSLEPSGGGLSPDSVEPSGVPSLSDDGPTSFDLLSSSLRADSGDVGIFLQVLGKKLADALPDQVRVEFEQKRFRKSGEKIRQITVTLDELEFEIQAGGSRILATINHVVRGVRLKSEQVGVDDWIEALSKRLADAAEKSSRAREAVSRLLL
jgi:hypothetical protein